MSGIQDLLSTQRHVGERVLRTPAEAAREDPGTSGQYVMPPTRHGLKVMTIRVDRR